MTPLNIFVPRRTGSTNLNAENAFQKRFIFPSGIFEVEKEYDSKYVYVPIEFARELTENEDGVSSIEIRFKDQANPRVVQKEYYRNFWQRIYCSKQV